MAVKVAINGLGRIGRCVLRAYKELKRKDIEIVAVNGPAPAETHVHLLKYDSVHGTFASDVKHENGSLVIDGEKIKLYGERDINKLDWKGIDVVMECTGAFTKKQQLEFNIEKGDKRKF